MRSGHVSLSPLCMLQHVTSQNWQQWQCSPEVLWFGGFEEQKHRGCLDTFRSPVSLEKKLGENLYSFFPPYETENINCLIHLFSVQRPWLHFEVKEKNKGAS